MVTRILHACGVTMAVLLVAFPPPVAHANPTILSTWQGSYPLSHSDDNASCNLCHGGTTSKWNPYGWSIRVGIEVGGKTIAQAILDAETPNSDADAGAFSNLDEIGADTQPGWTTGAANTVYNRDGTFVTGQTAPAIAGSLDPGVPPTTTSTTTPTSTTVTSTSTSTTVSPSTSASSSTTSAAPPTTTSTTVPPSCGDGILDPAEECDDGNRADGDCCSAACTFEPAIAVCAGDADLCTTDRCDGAGQCIHPAEPDAGCAEPPAGKGVITIKNLPGVVAGDTVKFKWSGGPAVDAADFGDDPAAGSPRYALCLYDGRDGTAVEALHAEPLVSADCNGVPCWKPKPGVGWKFKAKDGLPDGITVLVLKGGVAGKAKVQVKGKGVHLVLPELPLAQSPSVVAQLRTSSGKCWGAVFSTHTKNDGERFGAKSD